MDTRLCKVCNQEKPDLEYYARVKSRCKECHKESVRKNRREKIDHYREYEKARAMLPHRVRMREAYQKTAQGKDAIRRAHEASKKRFPLARKARVAVGNAIRDGKLVRQPCEVCGSDFSEAHHPDYAKPLDVMWLCRKHHDEWHHDNGPGLNADAPIEGMGTKAA